MSIIHDALKKTQTDMGNMKTNQASEQPNAVGPSIVLQPAPTHEWAVIFSSIALGAVVIFVIIPQAMVYYPAMKEWWQKTHPAPAAVPAPSKPVENIPTQTAPAQAPVTTPVTSTTPATLPPRPAEASLIPPAKEIPPPIKIQGVMAQGNGNVALINGHVYEEGDEVDGAKILKINMKNVVVLIDGQEKNLLVGK